MLLPEGNDPRLIDVGVAWSESGWCVGQFRVQSVAETATEIKLGMVVDIEDPSAICPGVGTDNNRAWAEVKLKAPLGKRKVIRAKDGAILPVIAADAGRYPQYAPRLD